MFCGHFAANWAQTTLLVAFFGNLLELSFGVDYGKACDHDDDCHDFRLVCSPYSSTCVCSRFFHRHPSQKVCNLNMTELKLFLSSLSEERDYREELDAQARSTFNQLGFAGILALSLGILGASFCTFFFCILDRKSRHVGDKGNSGQRPLLPAQQDPGANLAPSTEAGPSDATVLTMPVDVAMDVF